MGRSSIFSLDQIYRKQVVGTWSKIPEVFRYVNSLGGSSPAGTDYGYNAGGYVPSSPSRVSRVDRIDYGNDTATASPKGSLSVGRNGLAAVSSQSFGYVAGGIGGSPAGDLSTIDRIDYSNDTPTASPKGNLSSTRHSGCPVGNKDFGYVVSGRYDYSPGGNQVNSTIDRIDYSSDTSTALLKGNTTIAAYFFQAGAGNQSYGYVASVRTPSITEGTTINRIDYSNDTATASVKGPLAHQFSRGAATGNANYGYVGGGLDFLYTRTYVQRIDYASDTSTTVNKGPLVLAKYTHSATSSTTHGYFSGGKNPGAPSVGWSNTDRIDYDNDTATAVDKSPLSAARTYLGSTSSREYGNPTTILSGIVPATRTESGAPSPVGTDYGYFSGGISGSKASSLERIDYNNDTATTVQRGPLTYSMWEGAAVSSQSYGYWSGGNTPPNVSKVDRLDYANDSATALTRVNLQTATRSHAAAGTVSYGYFSVGWDDFTDQTKLQRLDYSSDTTALSLKATTLNHKGMTAAGNQSYGYWAGGNPNPGTKTTTVQRLDYASDDTALAPKGNLTHANWYFGGTGNASYGYFAGGPGTPRTVNRIDYSNDTATASPKGPLTQDPNGGSATGNTSYGYFMPGGPSGRSTIDRVDYSDDTATASPKGPLSTNRMYGNSGASSPRENAMPTTLTPSVTVDKGAEGYTNRDYVGGPAYGYVMAGFPPNPNNSSVDRIDFSNDTATASNRAGILIDKRNFSSSEVSSTTHGYLVGGQLASGSPSVTSSVEKIDYANDTASAAAVGKLVYITRHTAGASNPAYGWSAGGDQDTLTTQNVSTVQRLDFSNDSATQSPKGPLAVTTKDFAGATGNQSYGWWAGGRDPSQSSRVQRIDYSNDTATASTKGPLNATKYSGAAVGNADYGYFAAGEYDSSTQDRVDYANDTATASPKGNLPIKVSESWGTGDTNYGFYTGGDSQEYHGAPTVSSVFRTDFSNDTANASTKGPLSTARRSMASTGGRKNALGTLTSIYIPRIRWVDSVAENPGAPGPIGPAYGYVAGGEKNQPSALSLNQRIDYSNDTSTTSSRGNFPTGTEMGGAAGNLSYGYKMGGYDDNTWNGASKVYRIDYANDTGTPTTKGPLSAGRKYCNSVGNTTYGYTGGGYPFGSIIDRLDYANDTATASSLGNIFSPGDRAYATAGNLSFGYFAGGGGNYPRVSTVSRLDYANDGVATSPKGPLIGVLDNGSTAGAGTGNQNFGYFQTNSGYQTTTQVSRVDYANDTATALSKGPLTADCYMRSATGDSNFGYFSGGYQWPVFDISTIDRIDYSNDTATASPKGPLSTGARRTAGVSSQIVASFAPPTILAPVQPPFPFPVQLPGPGPAYGYFGGGRYPSAGNYSIVDRVDYSNDTPTMSVRGNLSQDTKGHGATGNKEYGYFGGGRSPSVLGLSTVNRVDYSNDSVTAEVKGSLSYADQGIAATGNVSYGYFMGGPSLSTVSRIDFSSDTSTATTKGPLSAAKWYGAATGNQSYGYVGGGMPASSLMDRLDYASDSSTASPKGPLTAQRYAAGATGNSSYGYFGGGRSGPSRYTIVDRLDYANDTATTVAKGPLTSARQYLAATGDASFGYIAGGFTSSSYQVSIVDRLDYANDTATAVAKGPLSSGRATLAGASARANGLPQ